MENEEVIIKKVYESKKINNTKYVNNWRAKEENREKWNLYVKQRYHQAREKKLKERKLQELERLSG